MRKFFLLINLLIVILAACNKSTKAETSKTNDPNFKIITSEYAFHKQGFKKKVVVFDIPIYAVSAVENSKLLHAANIMAQYLDNDEDGNIDNSLVHETMKKNEAFVIMWAKESDLEVNLDESKFKFGQDLGNNETIPDYYKKGLTGQFDASYEEILHIITHAGYSQAYPTELGEAKGSLLTEAMDLARGGHFEKVPSKYPENAWFTYYDETADYKTMATEYLYWGLTSILGAQKNRSKEIGHEWKPNTEEKVKTIDPKLYNLLTNPKFKLPTVLPDGTYRH